MAAALVGSRRGWGGLYIPLYITVQPLFSPVVCHIHYGRYEIRYVMSVMHYGRY